MDQEELETLLPIWQKILRLQDWDFKIKIVDDLKGALATSDCDRKYRQVLLKFCRYTPDSSTPDDDPEDTLVHEMIHAAMCPFDFKIGYSSPEFDLVETFVDQTAKALVALRRKNAQ